MTGARRQGPDLQHGDTILIGWPPKPWTITSRGESTKWGRRYLGGDGELLHIAEDAWLHLPEPPSLDPAAPGTGDGFACYRLRVLLFGSRHSTDPTAIHTALAEVRPADVPPDQVLVMHGGCRGADLLTDHPDQPWKPPTSATNRCSARPAPTSPSGSTTTSTRRGAVTARTPTAAASAPASPPASSAAHAPPSASPTPPLRSNGAGRKGERPAVSTGTRGRRP